MEVLSKVINDKNIKIFIDFERKRKINNNLSIVNHYFLFKQDENIIGYCEASPFVTKDVFGIFISQFEIEEEYQKQGYGKNLYKTIEHIYKEEGFSVIELSTPETNSQGKAFWLRMDFDYFIKHI